MTSPRSFPRPMYALSLLLFICSSSLLAIAISPPPPPNIPLQPLPPSHSPSPYYTAYSSAISANSGYSTPPQGYKGFNPSMAIVIIVLLGAFFFMGFFSVYVRRCAAEREIDISLHHHPHAGEGDDDQYHPQFYYGRNSSSIDGHVSDDENSFSRRPLRQGGGFDTSGLPSLSYTRSAHTNKTAECVVCLGEFQEGDALHLLPKCGHFFHQDCIDMWLFSHTTCPLCRRSLFDKGVVSAASPLRNPIPQGNSLENPRQDVIGDLQNSWPQAHRDTQNPGQQARASYRPFADTELQNASTEEMQASILSEQSQDVQSSLEAELPHPAAESNLNPALTRCHSTGHSLPTAAAGGPQNPRVLSPSTPISAVSMPPLSDAIAGIGHRSWSHTTLSNLQNCRHPDEQDADAEDRSRGKELQSARREGWSFLSRSSRSEASRSSDQAMVSSSTRFRRLAHRVCTSGSSERDDLVHLARVL